MHLSRNHLEKAGSDVMALAVLRHLNEGAIPHAAIIASEATKLKEPSAHSELNALAAAAYEKSGNAEKALACWDAALAGTSAKMKWLEPAIRSAWRIGTECALRSAIKWQGFLETLYSEMPSPQFLLELTQHGWLGKGSLGIKDGMLMGWLWLKTDEKPALEIEANKAGDFTLTLKSAADIAGYRLYTVGQPVSHKEFGLALKDGNGNLINGCPIFFSQPSLIRSEKKQENKVTILIPVYGDREATLACIGSVLASKKKNRFKTEILAIWDCGNEKRLLADLRKLAQRQKIRLLENPQNMGFLASVNRGMSQIKTGHILLLNADTIVHGDWVDRMAAIAGRKGAATVTALSNAAELMSYPSKAEPGRIESLNQTKLMDRAVAKLDPDLAAQVIPTGVGFCMLITRNALTRIGGLDGNMLFRGYGEEVEFCLRARDAGMINYGAFNVFVAHRGERSFGQTKKALAIQNNRVIYEKYPDHKQEYEDFLAQETGKAIRHEISLALLKELGEFDCLELRPWATRHLPPWATENDMPREERGIALFIKAGPKPLALLKIASELPVAEMLFDLGSDPASLHKALQDLKYKAVRHFACNEAVLTLAYEAGICEFGQAETPLLEPIPLPLAAGTNVLVAPPTGLAAWQRLCKLAKENPASVFYVFELAKLWERVPHPANIHNIPLEAEPAILNARLFLIMDRVCDAPAWREWLQSKGEASLTFCTVAENGIG